MSPPPLPRCPDRHDGGAAVIASATPPVLHYLARVEDRANFADEAILAASSASDVVRASYGNALEILRAPRSAHRTA